MMNEIFRLFGTIAVKNDDANRQIRQTSREANKLQTTMTTAFNKIGKASAAVGKAAVAGLGAATVAMGALIAKSMNLAGELEQNMGGSEAVFGIHAHRMQMLAAEAYKRMGLSQSEYLASANKMGSLFQGMGFSVSESADMTAKAMQRAADVASIMGISQEDAMEAVAGMAKGNFTMMDNLGVAMNDTALAAYAVEKGISKSVSKMATNEKVALAYQMFMEKSAYAAGNYAKENETLAGSLSTAKAAWKNFLSASDTQNSEVMMRGLVDSFVNAGEVVTKNLTKIVPRLAKGLSTLIQRLTPYVPELLQALLPGLIAGAVSLITGLAEATPGILEVLSDILPGTLEQVVASLDQIFPALVAGVTSLVTALATNMPAILSSIGAALRSWAANGFWPLIQELFRIVFGVELPSWDDIEKSISAGWQQIEKSIRDWFKATFGIELPKWETVRNSIVAWWTRFKNKVGEFIKAVFGLNFADQDNDGVPWYTRIANWFINVMKALGGALLALVGLDFSDEDGEGKPWYQRILEWFGNILLSLGKGLLALVGLDFSDNDSEGKPWYQRILEWFGGIMLSLGKGLLALVGLDFSDNDSEGKPWYQRILEWFGGILASLGKGLLALVGIDVDAMAKAIDNTARDIKAWWENVKSKVSLGLTYTVRPDEKSSYGQAVGVNAGTSGGGGGGGTQPLRETRWDNMPGLNKVVRGFASGIDFVPGNDIAARLHYGEAVLTRSEANAWRRGQAGSIDYDKLAEAMAERPLAFNIDGKAFAVMLAREMNRAIGNRNIQTLMAMGG